MGVDHFSHNVYGLRHVLACRLTREQPRETEKRFVNLVIARALVRRIGHDPICLQSDRRHKKNPAPNPTLRAGLEMTHRVYLHFTRASVSSHLAAAEL